MTNRKLRNTLTATLLLLGTLALAGAAQAIEVRGKLDKARVRVQIAGERGNYLDVHARGCRPARPRLVAELKQHDRRIARRLSRHTGVSKRELLELRRQGYRWRQIGRWLGLRPRVVKAAWSQASWQNFLRSEQRIRRQGACRGPRYGHHGGCCG